jgi:hypothetical protein
MDDPTPPSSPHANLLSIFSDSKFEVKAQDAVALG